MVARLSSSRASTERDSETSSLIIDGRLALNEYELKLLVPECVTVLRKLTMLIMSLSSQGGELRWFSAAWQRLGLLIDRGYN